MGEDTKDVGIVFLIIFGVIIVGFIIGALIKKCFDDRRREKYRVKKEKLQPSDEQQSGQFRVKSPHYEVSVDNEFPKPGEEDEGRPPHQRREEGQDEERPPHRGREEDQDGQVTLVQSIGLSFDADK